MLRDDRRLVPFGSALALLLCVTLGAQTSQNTRATPAASGTGAISGVVSDASTKRPLSGVVVSLTGGGVSRRTISDSKGRFVFRALPAYDRYSIEASKPGYVAGGLATRYLFAGLTRLPLADGEWIPDANFVMERLGAISGSVVDEAGEPVVNIPVRVLTRIPVAGTTRLASGPAARTDDRGVYRVAGLASGSYIVAVQSVQSVLPPSTSSATAAGLSPMMISLGNRQVPQSSGLDVGDSWLVIGQYATPPAPINGQLRVYPPIFFANAPSIANATAVHIANGEEKRSIDFSVQPVRASQLSGRVTGPPEVLAGLVVRLLPEGTETLLTAGFEQATSLVRSDGTFTMVGVPPGRYTLEARTTVSGMSFSGHVLAPQVLTPTPGLVSMEAVTASFVTVESTVGSASFGTRYTTGHEAYAGSLAVTVGASDVSNLVVPMTRGVKISGRVIREDGAPLPDRLSVGVEPANGDPVLAGPPSDRTVARNPAGTFSIQGLKAGAYFLRVFPGLVKSITADGDYTNRPFDTTSGSDITDIVITITDKPATLSGVVRDRQGTATREGAVILFPAERELWTRFGVDPPRIRVGTYFGTRGYQMTLLPAGEYYVIAVEPSHRNAWHDPRFFAAAAPLATRVTLAWGTPAVQDLTIRQVVIK